MHVTASPGMHETRSRKVGETIDEKSTRQLGAPVIEVAALCCCGRHLHRSTRCGISGAVEVCECDSVRQHKKICVFLAGALLAAAVPKSEGGPVGYHKPTPLPHAP